MVFLYLSEYFSPYFFILDLDNWGISLITIYVSQESSADLNDVQVGLVCSWGRICGRKMGGVYQPLFVQRAPQGHEAVHDELVQVLVPRRACTILKAFRSLGAVVKY